MSVSVTIGGAAVAVVPGSFDLQHVLDSRSILRLKVYDATGTQHYTHGQNVTVTDTTLGLIFAGFVNTSEETKLVPGAAIVSTIDCMDMQYLADKRVNTTNYQNWFSGDIVADLCRHILAQEGVQVAYAIRTEQQQSDFAAGNQSNTAAYLSVGNGDLEIALAGPNFSQSEDSTAEFAAGTLTNVVASNGTLLPVAAAAMLLQGTITGSPTDADLYIEFTTKNYAIVNGDTLSYDLWIASSSPSGQMGLDFVCTDGTTFRDSGILDQNGYSCHPHTDLAGVATNLFYKRHFDLSPLAGKTIDYMTLVLEHNSQSGTYTGYVRNVNVNAGATVFFATNATQLPLTPPLTLKNSAYYPYFCTVVQTYDQSNAVRTSPSYGLAATGIVRSSYLAYVSSTIGSGLPPAVLAAQANASTSTQTVPAVVVSYSLDDGVTYQTCTNNAPLPNLLPGQALSGQNLLIQETFLANGCADPTQYSVLTYLIVTVAPACANSSLPTPVTYTAATPAQWNAGTLTNLVTGSAGDISTDESNRNWAAAGASLANQTLWGTGAPTQAIASSALQLTTNAASAVVSQLNFAGNWGNFRLEFDMLVDSTTVLYGCVYCTTYWGNTDDTWGYEVAITMTGIELKMGTNNSTGGTPVSIGSATFGATLQTGTWYHITVDHQGSTHHVSMDGVQYISASEGSYTSGGIGLRLHNVGTAVYTGQFNNFGVTQTAPIGNMNGSWVGAAQSLTALATLGSSIIYWDTSLAQNANNMLVTVQVSLDGGVTWTACTSGQAIPGIAPGLSASGLSMQIQALLTTTSAASMPDLRNLVWRVLPQYSASGARTTAPLVTDTFVRSNQSGWGSSFDGQPYTQVGSGTAAISSNEGTISAAVGPVEMVAGARSAADQDGTVRFALSVASNGTQGGLELRRVDATHFFRLYATTTSLVLQQQQGGSLQTLTTAVVSLTPGTYYRMRLRVQGAEPINLWARVWPDGTLEPTSWTLSYTE